MKTAEELNAIKEEVETLNKKLAELSEEEISQIFGGRETKIKRTGFFPGDPCPALDGGILVKDPESVSVPVTRGDGLSPRIIRSVCPVCRQKRSGYELMVAF